MLETNGVTAAKVMFDGTIHVGTVEPSIAACPPDYDLSRSLHGWFVQRIGRNAAVCNPYMDALRGQYAPRWSHDVAVFGVTSDGTLRDISADQLRAVESLVELVKTMRGALDTMADIVFRCEPRPMMLDQYLRKLTLIVTRAHTDYTPHEWARDFDKRVRDVIPVLEHFRLDDGTVPHTLIREMYPDVYELVDSMHMVSSATNERALAGWLWFHRPSAFGKLSVPPPPSMDGLLSA